MREGKKIHGFKSNGRDLCGNRSVLYLDTCDGYTNLLMW